jgi:hypothetical protein
MTDAREMEEWENYLDSRRWDAWAEFVMDGTPSVLADFIELDGEVVGQVRDAVIEVLRNGPGENPGGRKRWRDYQAHVAIGLIMAFEEVNFTEACRRYAEKTCQELRTVQQQYHRGDRIFGNNHEK